MQSRTILSALLLASVAACSQADEKNGKPAETIEKAPAADLAAAEAAGGAPEIGQDVAPGVAFDYDFVFSLPGARIAKAQEDHAALCVKLTAKHCRVTGVTYQKRAEDDISASLSFAIDPVMAPRFTREATEIVERADGTASSANVNGTDVGSEIVAADRKTADLDRELARLEAQLRIPRLSNAMRQQLTEQARQIRAQLSEIKQGRETAVDSLATTPVKFSYASAESILGFRQGSTVQQALSASTRSFETMLSFLVIALGVLAPWALAGGAIWWIVRRLHARRRAVETVE